MSVIQFFRLLNRNKYILIFGSLTLAVIVWVYNSRLPAYYETRTEIYTGLTSGTNVDAIAGGALTTLMANNQFENLLSVVRSDQTLEEVGERLLAEHLALSEPQKTVIGKNAWENLQQTVPEEVQEALVVPDSQEATILNIRNFKEKYFDSEIVEHLFVNESSPYSVKGIKQNLTAQRLGGSDMVQFTYRWTDPGICQRTLEVLTKVFVNRRMEMKIGQSNDVVAYFRRKVEEAREELSDAEDLLTEYRVKNQIINYEQQTEQFTIFQKELEAEYEKEKRILAAAEAAVEELQSKLEPHAKLVAASEQLLEKKKRLADINARVDEMTVYLNDVGNLDTLRNEAAVLETELSNTLERMHQLSRTKEGVPHKEVLREWMRAIIALGESRAKVEVLEERYEIFEKAYREFSPLGAGISRLQRMVGVAERHYLELNHSLNVALIRQQSEALTTGALVVAVPPEFPVNAIKTDKPLLIIAAAIVGFVLPLSFVLMIAFLDSSIRTPVRAEEKTGLKLLGAYPDLHPGSGYKNVDMNWLTDKSVSNVVQNLQHVRHKKGPAHLSAPQVVLVFSTRAGEGKNLLMNTIANELAEINKKVAVASYKGAEAGGAKDYDAYHFEGGKDFLKVESIENIVPRLDRYDYVLVSIEALLSEKYPLPLIGQFDAAICVVSAKRAWNEADQLALGELSELLKIKPRVLLNAVAPDYMDSVVGEIKKSRSAVRRFFKSLLTFQFAKGKLS